MPEWFKEYLEIKKEEKRIKKEQEKMHIEFLRNSASEAVKKIEEKKKLNAEEFRMRAPETKPITDNFYSKIFPSRK